MNTYQKLFLILKAIEKEVELVCKYRSNDTWAYAPFKWSELNGGLVDLCGEYFTISFFLENCFIRLDNGVPKLTEAEMVYLSFYPREFFLTRDQSGHLFVHRTKPTKGVSHWDQR